MNYPIVQIKTPDHLWLHGLFIEARDPKALFLNIHGTASNFYEEYFIEVMTEKFVSENSSMLSVNNRGAGVYDAWQSSGAATEKFEDCVTDIDSWIAFAKDKGYKKIFLSGHSLGAEKVVYYMSHGKYTDMVTGLILLAPADSYGSHRMDSGKPNTKVLPKLEEHIREAQRLVESGQGETLLPRDTYGSHRGIMPKSANSLLNFLGPNSKVLEALPFVTRRLVAYSQIKVPILVVIGDGHEYTGLSIEDTLKLLREQNPQTKTVQLHNCSHDFEGCEEELTDIVSQFMKKELS